MDALTPTASADGVAAAGAMPLWRRWFLAIRPRTLTASVVPVIVGLALAPPHDAAGAAIAAVTLAAALCIQAAVNLANDYYDHASGIDTHERLGPTRAVQAGLLSAETVRRGFLTCVAVAAVLGLPLIARGGVPILFIGVASLACAWAYAGGPYPLASHGLGDVFVFVFFGLVPVAGTVWLQRGDVDADAFLVAVPIGVLAVAILVVNNLRDIRTDAAAGKWTTAVLLGEPGTRRLYAALLALALAWPVLLVPRFGAGLLIVLLAAPPAWRTAGNLTVRSGSALNASLGETARLQLVYALLFAVALLLF